VHEKTAWSLTTSFDVRTMSNQAVLSILIGRRCDSDAVILTPDFEM